MGIRLPQIVDKENGALLLRRYVDLKALQTIVQEGLDESIVSMLYNDINYADLLAIFFENMQSVASYVDARTLGILMEYKWTKTIIDKHYIDMLTAIITCNPNLAPDMIQNVLKPPLAPPNQLSIEVILTIIMKVPNVQIMLSQIFYNALPATRGIIAAEEQCMYGVMWFCALSEQIPTFVSYIDGVLECIIKCGSKEVLSALGGWIMANKDKNPALSQRVIQGVLELCGHVQFNVTSEILPLLLCIDKTLTFDALLADAQSSGGFEALSRIVFFTIRTCMPAAEGKIMSADPMGTAPSCVYFNEGEVIQQYISDNPDRFDDLADFEDAMSDNGISWKARGKQVDAVVALLCGWMDGYSRRSRARSNGSVPETAGNTPVKYNPFSISTPPSINVTPTSSRANSAPKGFVGSLSDEDKGTALDCSLFPTVFGLFCYFLSKIVIQRDLFVTILKQSNLGGAILVHREALFSISPYLKTVFKHFWVSAGGDPRILEIYSPSDVKIVIKSNYPSPFERLVMAMEEGRDTFTWYNPCEVVLVDFFSEW